MITSFRSAEGAHHIDEGMLLRIELDTGDDYRIFGHALFTVYHASALCPWLLHKS
jgi:hypothetical protein